MKITKVVLDHFKVYNSKKEFVFDDGFNLILARNGSGKSTIIDAIQLILFDNNRASNLSSLSNWDDDKDYFYIELHFIDTDISYKLTYEFNELNSPKTARQMYKGNTLLVDKASAVVTQLKSLFDLKLMESALFSRQRVNKFVDVTNSERRETLRKIRNIDYTNEIKEIIAPEIRRLDAELTEINKVIYALENQEYEIPVEKDLPLSEEQVIEYQGIIDKLTITLNAYDTIQEKYSSLLNEISSLQVENIDITHQIEEKEKTIFDNSAEISRLSNEHVQAIDQLNKEIGNYQGILQEQYTKPDIKSYEVSINEYEKTLQTEFTNQDEQVIRDKYADSIIAVKNQIKELEEKISNIVLIRLITYDDFMLINLTADEKSLAKKLDLIDKGICPECQRPFHSNDREKVQLEYNQVAMSLVTEKEKKKEYEEKRKLNDENKELKTRLNIKLNELKDTIEEYYTFIENDIINQKNQLQTDKDSANRLLKMTKEQMDYQLSNSLSQFQQRQESTNKSLQMTIQLLDSTKEQFIDKKTSTSKRNSKLDQEIKALKEKIEDNKSVIESKMSRGQELENIKDDKYDDKKKEVDNLTQQIKVYEEVVYHNSLIKNKIKEIEIKKENDKINLKNSISKRDQLQKEKLDYETAQNFLLRDFPNFVIGETIGDLQCDINEFVDNTYTKSLDIKLKSNKNSIALSVGRKNADAKSALSGAEGQIVQLGFINSFNRKLDLQCIFLDEPDTSVDDNNASELYEVLGEMSEYYKQLFVITHKKGMAEYLENTHKANIIRL